jgi:hypothetical protein
LEKRAATTIISESPWLMIVYNETGKPSQAALDKAKAEYINEHPEYNGEAFNIIWVASQECKENVEQIIAGEMPWRVNN